MTSYSDIFMLKTDCETEKLLYLYQITLFFVGAATVALSLMVLCMTNQIENIDRRLDREEMYRTIQQEVRGDLVKVV